MRPMIVCLLVFVVHGRTPCASGDAPGTSYPPMKVVFADPATGRTVWRMTTDGIAGGGRNFLGDYSSEVTAWSPDSRRIAYTKWIGGSKPAGVYVMDVESGVETYVGRGESPAFSRSSAEIFFVRHHRDKENDVVEERSADLIAVDLATFQERVVIGFPRCVSMQTPQQNLDGSWIAVFPKLGPVGAPYAKLSEQCVLVTPQGEVHPEWAYRLDVFDAANADGCIWSPVDAKILLTRRFVAADRAVTRFWHIDSLAQPFGDVGQTVSHSSWHPNGHWYLRNDVVDLRSGDVVHGARIGGAVHPHIDPTASADSGLTARVVLDARRPPHGLHVLPLSELPLHGREGLQCLHYSSAKKNVAHCHPHWSPDARYILWQSDLCARSEGQPPGGVDDDPGTVDLFILPLGVEEPAPVGGR